MYDLIIVGGGPAGLTAALYAARANKKVLVLEAKNYGGQILKTNKIENYPGIPFITGSEYANNLYNQVKALGTEFRIETVLRIDENKNVKTNLNEYQAKAIILATGAENRKLNLENESKFIGKGISYCATSDGKMFKEKDVAIIGGGDTALKDAIFLSKLAKKVYIIHRRDEFRGENKYVTELNNMDNVEFVLNSNVIRVNGNETLESIDVLNNNTENERNIKVEGLFIAVGQEPKNQIFANIVHVNEAGYIESDDGVRTNINGIYVAGDTRVKELRQLATAVGDGANAAIVAIKEMRNINV